MEEPMAAGSSPPVPEAAGQPWMERLADRLGIVARARTIYADPVERDGVTIIPVAKVRYGFGGGGGPQGHGGPGYGGGGGVKVKPVGYIEIRRGETRFRPIHDPLVRYRLALLGGLLGWLALRSWRRYR